MERSWILLGMMGAGKSSVGRALAELSGREFFDTDLLLQHKLGRPIPQIFELYGEQAFRDHESSILRSLQPGQTVLATGGGIVCRDENWIEMRRLGATVYLKAERTTLLSRLEKSKKKRPLLADDDWQERLHALLDKRLPQYERADLVVDVDDVSIEEAAERVRSALGDL
ncbi:MAG TPA: shikimate kinase [Fimbriimonas sp.]|nr:shikimate kinase [Fimbriimonas sp.]